MFIEKADIQAWLRAYPEAYRQAVLAVKTLETQVEDLEEDREELSPPNTKDVRKKQRELIGVETAIEKLKVERAHEEAKIETDYISRFPRATISSAQAVVDANEEIVELKRQMTELQEKRKLLELDIKELEDMHPSTSHFGYRPARQPHPKLAEMRQKSAEARATVRTLKVELQVYRILLESMR